jgi:hypothetical protein
VVGQETVRAASKKLGGDRELAHWFSLAAHAAEPGPAQDRARFICLYGACHYLLKALIVTVISVALTGIIDVFADVGFIIAVYFLFRALAFVPHPSKHGTIEERKKRYKEDLERIRDQRRSAETTTKT